MKPSEQARSRRLRRICLCLEMDDFAGEIIVDLLEQMEAMQRDMERLRAYAQSREIDKR